MIDAPRLEPAHQRALLAWYQSVKRPLPWRATVDPYAIWISEVMSQQTRVETALPYWERWMQRFPTVVALAEAPLDDVLRLWAGLGYYSRARNLHHAAAEVVERFGGELPRTVEGLRSLRGVGEYTSAAVASIAYGLPVAVVDGNVERVVARWLRLEGDVHSREVRAQIRSTAAAALDRQQAGDFNQAMMELGATVCTPRKPGCSTCPASTWCAAGAAGDAERFPQSAPKAASPVSVWWGLICRDQHGALLMGRRSEGGLLGGLWEPPLVAASCDVPGPDLSQHGLAATLIGHGTPFTHVFSHRRWVVAPTRLALGRPTADLVGYSELGWFTEAGLQTLALSRLARKLIAAEVAPQQTLLHS